MAALCIFVVSAYALFASVGERETAMCAAGVALVVLSGFGLVRAGVRLNYVRARDATEPLVGLTTSSDVLALAECAAELSSHVEGDPRVMSWLVDEKLEVPLGWYMRGFEAVRYVSGVSSEPNVGGVIAPADAVAPEGFVGLRFRVHSEPSPTKYLPVDWMRWWTGHRSIIEDAVVGEHVKLWVKSPQQ
jgi:hypothetical protein